VQRSRRYCAHVCFLFRAIRSRCLLQRDANVNLFNHAGATALMCSVDRGHIKTMKLLVEMGHGSILTKDNDGNTALGIAKLNGYTEIAQYLELKSKKE
jgi:ankyrin repeat protein